MSDEKESTSVYFKRHGKLIELLHSRGIKCSDDLTVEVFHGSGVSLPTPSYSYKVTQDADDEKRLVLKQTDFGNGFYLDLSKDTCERWVLLYSRNSGRVEGEGYVNKYLLRLGDLNIKVLDPHNEEDMCLYIASLVYYAGNAKFICDDEDVISKFVKKYGFESLQDYDIIVGPRLDSAYKHIINDFIDESIGLDDFYKLINESDLGLQVYLQTEKAFNQLKYTESYEVKDISRTHEVCTNMQCIKDKYLADYIFSGNIPKKTISSLVN